MFFLKTVWGLIRFEKIVRGGVIPLFEKLLVESLPLPQLPKTGKMNVFGQLKKFRSHEISGMATLQIVRRKLLPCTGCPRAAG